MEGGEWGHILETINVPSGVHNNNFRSHASEDKFSFLASVFHIAFVS